MVWKITWLQFFVMLCNTLQVAQARISRVFSISLPPDLAEKAERLAQQESRTMSELFREAFRVYYARDPRRKLAEIGEYASTRNPNGYAEEDVPRLIKEARAERLESQTKLGVGRPKRRRA